jgi:LPS O-antigen subunit length determinant protein (WzzB/FepE family)
MGRFKEGIKQGWTDITTTTRKSAVDVVVATETAMERANASVRESLNHVSKGVYQHLDKKFPGKDYDLKANRAAEKEQKAADEGRSAKERMKHQ